MPCIIMTSGLIHKGDTMPVSWASSRSKLLNFVQCFVLPSIVYLGHGVAESRPQVRRELTCFTACGRSGISPYRAAGEGR